MAAAIPGRAEAASLPAPSAGPGERSGRWAAAPGAGARPGQPRFPKTVGFSQIHHYLLKETRPEMEVEI